MKKRRSNDTDYSYCVRNGLHIYPVYIQKKKTWHLQVEFKGKVEKTYEKPIGNAQILRAKHLKEPQELTAKYWAKKLEALYENDKKSSDRQPPDKVRNEPKEAKAGQKDR